MTLNALRSVIRRASRSVAHQWPGVVEAEDVEQSIYVRLLESEGSLDKISEMDELARYRAIVGIGHQIASEERTDYAHFKGNYRYSVAEAKDLLKQGILTENDDEVTRFRAEKVDLLTSLDSLKDSYAEAIRSRYADLRFPSTDSEKSALKRGLTALADGMNKIHRTRHSERDDGPGTREVISNDRAREISSADYFYDERTSR